MRFLSNIEIPGIVVAILTLKLDQRPYLSLFGYLIGFVPSISILFAFILPLDSYRSALFLFIKQMVPNRIRNWSILHRI